MRSMPIWNEVNVMQAAVLFAKDDIRCVERPIPPVGEGEVLVSVRACGICGSDVPRVNEGTARRFPLVLGHEFSGVVSRIGTGVTKVAPGDHVTGAGLVPCMQCEDCKNGDYALCKHYSFIGIWTDGAYADYVVMPEKSIVKLDASIPFEMAALFEPATVALHGIRRLPLEPGADVAVVGCGNIGLFAIQWAKILGARRVTALDLNEEKLMRARSYGADETVNTASGDFMEQVKALTKGRGFPYVYETAGTGVTMKMCFELVANKGKACIIGTQQKELVFPARLFEQLGRKEFFLTGSWMSYGTPFPGEDWTMTADCLKTGALRVDESFLFRKFPLTEARAAFDLFKTTKVDGKVLFLMPGE